MKWWCYHWYFGWGGQTEDPGLRDVDLQITTTNYARCRWVSHPLGGSIPPGWRCRLSFVATQRWVWRTSSVCVWAFHRTQASSPARGPSASVGGTPLICTPRHDDAFELITCTRTSFSSSVDCLVYVVCFLSLIFVMDVRRRCSRIATSKPFNAAERHLPHILTVCLCFSKQFICHSQFFVGRSDVIWTFLRRRFDMSNHHLILILNNESLPEQLKMMFVKTTVTVCFSFLIASCHLRLLPSLSVTDSVSSIFPIPPSAGVPIDILSVSFSLSLISLLLSPHS